MSTLFETDADTRDSAMVKSEISPTPTTADLCYRILNQEFAPISARYEAASNIKLEHKNTEVEKHIQALCHDISLNRIQSLPGALSCIGAEFASKEIDLATDLRTLRFIVTQYAPQGLLSGCVLQNMAHAGNSHEVLSAYAHTAHRWHLGNGIASNNHNILYRKWLDDFEIRLPEICSATFAACPEFFKLAWRLPAYRLSLSIYPDNHYLEIFGAALFELHTTPAPIFGAAFQVELAERNTYLSATRDSGREVAIREINSALTIILKNSSLDKAMRIARGYLTSLYLMNLWQEELFIYCQNILLNPEIAMIDLVRRKSRHAVGYHGKSKLGKEAFDLVIATDPPRFVRELANSSWIAPGEPDKSLLLTKLVDFDGPMFRVFSNEEV
jgi:hypothetical protein